MSPGPRPRLVLLDRDGVLNEDRRDYVKTPDELVLIRGAAAAVARLNSAGIRVALCTNQSAVGRGIISAAMLERIHERLREALAREGARLDAVFACPDPPGAPTTHRKPAPGMLIDAMRRFGVAAADAVMIGDSLRDLEAAQRAGTARCLVRTGHGARTQAEGLPASVLPVRVHADLAAAVAALLGEGA
ncbi:MAG: HAD-IIIA family hydrolase [Alphaproteobacteria bacterium]|nr:HAD-IIIA family hydrolase [Alphaproteobacteria bacterium]